MSESALHPVPRAGAVLREQFLATGVGLRRELLAAGVLTAFVTVIVFISIARGGGSVSMNPDGAGFLLGWIGLLAPLAVWKAEGPSARGYFLSLPVPRERHLLVRVFVGWAWLMIALAVFLGIVAVQSWLTGGGPGIDEMRWIVADGGAALHSTRDGVDPSLLREIRWTTPGWQWLVPFLAPSVAYLVGSVAALRSDYPWLWLAAPFIVVGALSVVGQAAGITWVGHAVEQLLAGRYGIETLFTGSNEEAVRVQLTNGARVFVWSNLAEAGQWLTTLAIWGVPALAATLVAIITWQER